MSPKPPMKLKQQWMARQHQPDSLSGAETAVGDAADDAAVGLGNAADAAEKLGKSTDQAADAAKKAKPALNSANKAAALEKAKEGSKNISDLDGKLQGVTEKLKSFAVAAFAYIVGDSVGNVVADTLAFTEGLADTAKALKKSTEEARSYQTA